MEENICQILGNNIKKIRKTKNLTQSKLAELLGIEVKSLSLIETGKGFASAKTLENLTKVLDVTATDLFAISDKKSNEIIYRKIIHKIKSIKNDTSKLETLEIILKGLI